MNTAPATTFLRVPLDKLELCPDQVRQHKANGIDAMAHSIAVSGLLQNLVVSTDGDGSYQVHAGSRRLRALQLLHTQGKLAGDFPVPCQVIDRGNALAAGLAENTLREAMHPADEFEAFRRLVEQGQPIEEVGAAFGVTTEYVHERLKLARVSPRLVDEYRAGAMKLDQLQAFTLTDDHIRQEGIWFDESRHYKPSGYDIRHALTSKTVSSNDGRVRFIGLEAYEAAGGAVVRDLFGGEAFLQDPELLDRLVRERLQAEAAALQAEGWSFVEIVPEIDYKVESEYQPAYGHVSPQRRIPTPEESDQLETLRTRLSTIDRCMQDEDEETDQARDLSDEADRIEEQLQSIEDGLEEYPAEVLQNAGVLVGLNDYNGTLRVLRGRLRPGQKLSKDGTVTGKPKPAADPKAKKKPDLSDAFVRRLSAHRTAALQRLLASNPKVALAALLHQLRGGANYGERVEISTDPPHIEKLGADVADSRALVELRELGSDLQDAIPTRRDLQLTTLLACTTEELLELLAYEVAVLYNAVHGAGGKPGTDSNRLAEALGLNMVEWWAPTSATFLESVPSAVIIAAVAEACGKQQAGALTGLKKKDLVVAKAEQLLAGTGWLPKPLRGPDWTPPAKSAGAKSPTPDAPAGAGKAKKKAPAKKAAGKKPVAKKAGTKAAPKSAPRRSDAAPAAAAEA